MNEGYDKREHSSKREVDDLTDYQKLNSLDGAGVLVNPEDIPRLNIPEEDEETGSIKPTHPVTPSDPLTVYDGDYNDGADFNSVDDEGKTNT